MKEFPILFNQKQMYEAPILLYPNHAQKLLGVKSTKFYELLQTPGFPKPRSVSGKRPMFLRKELEEWANNLAKVEDHNG